MLCGFSHKKTASLQYIWSGGYANDDVLHRHAAAMLNKRVPSGDAEGNHHRKKPSLKEGN